MCGIAGVVGAGAPAPFQALFAAVAHRGPDASGTWHDELVEIGMHRLRFRGADVPLPVVSSSRVSAYNGQIYGRFSDGQWEAVEDGLASEIVFAFGDGADGMYACSRYDAESGELSLRTDPYFIKPMFLRSAKGGLAFCSELGPLLAGSSRNRIEADALAELFAYGWYLSDQSWIQDVSLVWRHDVRVAGGKVFRHPAPCRSVLPATESTCATLRERIRNSVRHSTQGIGPLGLALSGGLDSTILAHELNALGIEDLVCITVASEGSEDGLRSLAELGLPDGGSWRSWRHVRVLTGDEDFLAAFESSTREFAQPTSMSSLPLYRRLAEAAAEAGVRALLLGEGVDEYFAGYASYTKVRNTADIVDYYRDDRRTRLTHTLFGNELARAAASRFKDVYGAASDIRAIETEMRLTRLLLRSDVCLMGRSIEGRVPFLHNEIPALAMAVPFAELLEGGGKSILRRAYAAELGARARAPKVRFKAPDDMLTRCLARSDVRDRIVGAAGQVFGSDRVASALSLLVQPCGYDADTLCLLLSLSYLLEGGTVDAHTLI